MYGYPAQQQPYQTPEQVIAKLVESVTYHKIDLQQLFNAYDTDHDGRLSIFEFGSLCKKIDSQLSEPEIESTFRKFDQNNTRSITFQEFQSVLSPGQEGDMQKAEEAIHKLLYAIQYYNINLGELFQKYDKSQSASLDLIEFGTLMRKIDPNLTQKDVEYAFLIFDSDGSKTIDFNEFVTVFNTITNGQYKFMYTHYDQGYKPQQFNPQQTAAAPPSQYPQWQQQPQPQQHMSLPQQQAQIYGQQQQPPPPPPPQQQQAPYGQYQQSYYQPQPQQNYGMNAYANTNTMYAGSNQTVIPMMVKSGAQQYGHAPQQQVPPPPPPPPPPPQQQYGTMPQYQQPYPPQYAPPPPQQQPPYGQYPQQGAYYPNAGQYPPQQQYGGYR